MRTGEVRSDAKLIGAIIKHFGGHHLTALFYYEGTAQYYLHIFSARRYNVLKIKERPKIMDFIYAKHQGGEKLVYFNGSPI